LFVASGSRFAEYDPIEIWEAILRCMDQAVKVRDDCLVMMRAAAVALKEKTPLVVMPQPA
jgi:3-polyprenyl-4-hydroxybenzoate decarboxylase